MKTSQESNLSYLKTLAALDEKLRGNFNKLSQFMKLGGAPGPLVLSQAQAAHAVNKQIAYIFKKAGRKWLERTDKGSEDELGLFGFFLVKLKFM